MAGRRRGGGAACRCPALPLLSAFCGHRASMPCSSLPQTASLSMQPALRPPAAARRPALCRCCGRRTCPRVGGFRRHGSSEGFECVPSTTFEGPSIHHLPLLLRCSSLCNALLSLCRRCGMGRQLIAVFPDLPAQVCARRSVPRARPCCCSGTATRSMPSRLGGSWRAPGSGRAHLHGRKGWPRGHVPRVSS